MVVTLAGCSPDDESACDRLNERLDSVEAQAAGLSEQSWENVRRMQDLQAERTNLRRQLADAGCTAGQDA